MSSVHRDRIALLSLYLPLLDDASGALASATRQYLAQRRKKSSDHSALVIASALRDLELAVAKILKAALVAVDPYLIFADLRPELVQNLRRELSASGAPSLLAVKQRIRTHETMRLLDIAFAQLAATLDQSAQQQFSTALNQLVVARNAAQHGELFGESDYFLSVLDQVLAKVIAVLGQLCPNLVPTLEKKYAGTVRSLRAIERRVDEAWAQLMDYFETGRPLTFDIRISVATFARDSDLEVTILHHAKEQSGYLVAGMNVPWAFGSGLFHTILTPDEAWARNRQRFGVKEPEFVSAPTTGGPLGLLFTPPAPVSSAESRLMASIETSLRRQRDRQKAKAQRYGIASLEAGELLLPRSTAWAQVRLAGKKQPTTTVEVAIENATIRLPEQAIRGSMTARLKPQPTVALGAALPSLVLAGRVWLTDEFALPGGPTATLPAQTVRIMRARLLLAPADDTVNEA